MKKLWIIIAILIVAALTIVLILTQTKVETKEIKIGAMLPLTGDGALYGEMARKAIELGLEEINAKGGIKGKNLSVIYEDTQFNPKIATQAAQKLITIDKVLVIIGPMASNCFLPVAPIAEKNKVILISPSATSHVITDAGDYIFRTIVSDIYDGTAMAQFAYNKLEYKTVGVFYVDEAGPKGVTQAFIEEFKRLGGAILIEETGTQDGTDFRSQITKIKNSDPNLNSFA